jgi:uncharacterized protein YndB with AHSA1/START domain
MQPQTAKDLVVEVTVDAPPESVFPYITDPDKMVRWFGTKAEVEARAGGPYYVEVTPQAHARGEFVEIDPPHRVIFTFGWENHVVEPGSSTVEIELIPQGQSTLVRLTHRGLPGDEIEIHRQGWAHYTERLRVAAAGGDPGPDPMLAAQPNAAR